MKLLVLLLVLAGCSKDPTSSNTTTTASGGSSSGSCGELGGKCSKEGEMCTPAPIGSGWAHALHCSNGKWTELEIAPLPPPRRPKPSGSTP